MSEEQIYCDHSATTPVAPEVVREMTRLSTGVWGNASSIHQTGRNAKVELEHARERIAGSLNAARNEIFFTSGGTEADNFALRGIVHALRDRGNHIITSVIEHEAVLRTCKSLEDEGFEVTYLQVDSNGTIFPDRVRDALTDSTILVSIMHANNEIGTINPIEGIGEITEEHGIVLHTDAVQSYGKLPIDVRELSIDALSVSGHKIYGPKGIGFLYLSREIDAVPLLTGGSQERHLRAGTENLPAIGGLARAVETMLERRDDENRRLGRLTTELEQGLRERIPGSTVHGAPGNRVPGLTNVGFSGVDSESLVMNLDMQGIAVSSGSACSSGTVEPSYVLRALGYDEKGAKTAIRISLGRSNTREQIPRIIDAVAREVERIRNAGQSREPASRQTVSSESNDGEFVHEEL